MRIWDLIAPENQCEKHNNGEWQEWFTIFTAARDPERGYGSHPECVRWQRHQLALWGRAFALREERLRRGKGAKEIWGELHAILLDAGADVSITAPTPLPDQIPTLISKGCSCKISVDLKSVWKKMVNLHHEMALEA